MESRKARTWSQRNRIQKATSAFVLLALTCALLTGLNVGGNGAATEVIKAIGGVSFVIAGVLLVVRLRQGER